ncbi:MAG: GspE/PulE family protein [Planctomycetes bacterium]|jgi:type II secretory ATPase GspE/PulE/Tfp pilus assembly ATPase PilB-like protein|nr:GspE/PulE family protein [Planctomycetota bacterium]
MTGFASINSLLHPKKSRDDDETIEGKFAKKQQEIKLKDIENLTEAKANTLGLSYVNLYGFPVSPDAIILIPEEEARQNKIVCFFYDGKNIRIGAVNNNQYVIDKAAELDAQYFTNSKIYLISEVSLNCALEVYKTIPKTKKYEGVEIKAEDFERLKNEIKDFRTLAKKINEVNISEIVTLILATAAKISCSDIHIEAEERGIVIRLRIDGMLQEAAVIDRDKWKKVISRMKILAKVKINVENKPQDGRYTINLGTDKIDVRSSFLPTAFGESVVMRLLRSNAISLSFADLGLLPECFKVLEAEIAKPNGLILTTGPTGSGKTTTLYSVLNKLNTPDVKIITLEDPIEYQLKGISQSQIDSKKGYTFADGLRSILRQDPDIVMVGEIRDLETAEIAVEAALTGHLVLSTLHTNDAAGVIPRMIDMGIKPFFLVPALNVVVGQRLIRKLCPLCKVEHHLTIEEEELVKKILAVISPKSGIEIPSDLPVLYKAGAGCEKCNNLGYKGRIGIYEVFTMDDQIKQLAMDNAPSFKILQQAIENGMITMLQDGVIKATKGVTSLEEIYENIGNFDYINELYDIVVSQTVGRGIKISVEEMNKAKELIKNKVGIQEAVKKMPTKDVLVMIMAMAIVSRTGDLHIEPTETGVKFRFRIDGVLNDFLDLPKSNYLPLLSQVKILSGFATNVKKATMDGRFSMFSDGKKMDCRVSIISGGYGETIVIRLLTSQASTLNMEKLGITSFSLKMLRGSMKKTKGVIITTGPTGSGKTTTLYSVLNELNTPSVKIITVEDPIEYNMAGVMQTQIDAEHGYTFAAAMRSLLRQNPNVMMIGEIRDEETAKISIEAAMTGHLVLSTIHANSAAGAISRFVGLGVERQSLANSMNCSIGQRLVRSLCPNCKQPTEISPENLAEVKRLLDLIKNPEVIKPTELKFWKAVGCDQCNNIGYKGRLGLYEVIEMSPDIQKLIQTEGVTDYDIEQQAIANGTITMVQDGVLKALNGETTIEEVFRVIQ